MPHKLDIIKKRVCDFSVTQGKLHFRDIQEVVHVTGRDIQLPANMMFAEGDTRAEQYQHMVDILGPHGNSTINAVYITALPPANDNPFPIHLLQSHFQSRTIITAHPNDPARTIAALCKKKENELKTLTQGSTAPLQEAWESRANLTSQTNGIKLHKTRLRWQYDFQRTANNSDTKLGEHLDNPNADIRIFELEQGPSLLSFDDQDFDFPPPHLTYKIIMILCIIGMPRQRLTK